MTRGARAARGAAIAASATLVASLAHTAGGGAPPGPLVLVLSLAFSMPLAMLLTGGRMPLLRASVAALAAQAALHLLYALGTPGAGLATSAAPHASHGAPVVHLDGATAVVDHGHAVAMPFAHLVAAAATIAMLALLDRAVTASAVAFGTVVRGIRLLVGVLRGIPAPATPRRVLPPTTGTGPPNPGILLLSSLRHRGPPWASSAA
jgi:hypothetical protein